MTVTDTAGKPAKRAQRSTTRKPKAETIVDRALDATAGETDEPVVDDMGEELGPENIKRIPMGSRQARLAAEPRPGFYTRWINAVHGRVNRARNAGYVHRTGDDGKPIAAPVGRSEEGGGQTAYLMDQPEEFRKEDLALKDKVVRQIDQTIERGKYKEQQDDQRYVPEQGIRIKQAYN